MKFFSTFLLFGFATISVFADPPIPPIGYQWETYVPLSDEFDSTAVDESKWYKYNPYWVGRDPGRFIEDQVTVSNGMLQLKNTKVAETTEQVWVHTGFLASKTQSFFTNMYAECRMKAAADGTVTGFWMSRPGYYEIDVQEAIGYSPNGNQGLTELMRMNTHHHPNGWDSDITTQEDHHIGSVSDNFHLYGTWFEDMRNISFYYNDEQVTRVVTGGDFDLGMQINIDTECQTWLGAPIVNYLNNDNRNTSYIDYVRTWKLVADTSTGEGQRVALHNTGTSSYMSLSNEGTESLSTSATIIGDQEVFVLTHLGNGVVSLQGNKGKYISSENGTSMMTCLSDTVGDSERFTAIHLDGQVYAFKGNNGQYVGSDMWCNNTTYGAHERFQIIWASEMPLVFEEGVNHHASEFILQVFPNPAANNIHISGLVPDSYDIIVYSLQGKAMLHEVLHTESTVVNLNIEFLDSGLYLLQVRGENQVETLRFIKKQIP